MLTDRTGRFRLYFDKWGQGNNLSAALKLWAYNKYSGRELIWQSDTIHGQSEADFQFQLLGTGPVLRGRGYLGEPIQAVVFTRNYGYAIDRIELEDSGNISMWSFVRGASILQHVEDRATRIGAAGDPRFVVPGEINATLLAGRIAIDTSPVDYTVQNSANHPIGFSDGSQYRYLQPAEKLPVAYPGVLAISDISLDSYDFVHLHDDGSPIQPPHSGSAIAIPFVIEHLHPVQPESLPIKSDSGQSRTKR
jgi:hypothetical protein